MSKCSVCKTNEVKSFSTELYQVGCDLDCLFHSVCESCYYLVVVFDEFRKYSERIGLELKERGHVYFEEELNSVAKFLIDKKDTLTDLEIYSMWCSSGVRGFLLQSEFVLGFIADCLQALYTYSYFSNEYLISDNKFFGYA